MADFVRRAQMSDVKQLAELMTQLGYEADAGTFAPRLSHALSSADEQLLVAELDDHVVGWVHAAIWAFLETGRIGMIAGLVVERGHRRQGIGRTLMCEAEDWIAAKGCSVVRLWSSTGRVEAHRFYEGLGYSNIKTQYSFAKLLHPGIQNFTEFVPKIDS